MLQSLPIALAQGKHAIHLKTYYMKSDKLYILCIAQKKLLKKLYDNIMNSINLYYIYEF